MARVRAHIVALSPEAATEFLFFYFYKYQNQEQGVQPVACRDFELSAGCNQAAINTTEFFSFCINTVPNLQQQK